MTIFEEAYNERKKEIDEFIEFIKFLEQTNSKKIDGKSKFDEFFYSEDDDINDNAENHNNIIDDDDDVNEIKRISMTFQSLINILKSNLSLMLYNLIEFAVVNLMECICEKIRDEQLSYLDVNDFIKTLWKKTILKAANDPNANFYTFVKKNDEIINKIINKSVIELKPKNSLPAGNLDGATIKETFDNFGVSVNINSENYKPGILKILKNNRNDLAHGTVSFVDALRNSVISETETEKNFIVNFIDEIIISVTDYISKESYKNST